MSRPLRPARPAAAALVLALAASPVHASAPEAAPAPASVVVTSGPEFLHLAAFLADFRRQAEIEAGLAGFNTRKAAAIRLAEVNSASLVADLAAKGYLARAGGPPSGRGFYSTDPEGRVSSSVFGSAGLPFDPPQAWLAGDAARIEPAAILAALATKDPAAFECGLPRLPAAVLSREWSRIATQAQDLTDPWALDSILAALDRELAAGGTTAAKPMAGFLTIQAANAPEPARWQALALAWDLGQRDRLPSPDRAEAERILDEVGRGRLPRWILPAALRALPAAGRDLVVAALRSGIEPRFLAALDAAQGLPERVVLTALIDALDGPMARDWGPRIASVLTILTGKDLGPDEAAWRRWLSQGG